MRTYIPLLAILSISLALHSCASTSDSHTDGAQDPSSAVASSPVEDSRSLPCTDSLDCTSGKIRNGQFFSTILDSFGLSAKQSYDIAQASADVFDVRSIRVGNTYRAYFSASDHTPQYLIYDKDRITSVVFTLQPPYEAWTCSKPVETRRRYADVTIRTSLWNDMIDAGVSPLLILSLSDIYAWTVDFFGLQKGDRFRVLYDERVCDGEVMAVDSVRYAVYTTRSGKDFPMIMFNQNDGGNIWWNAEGESMRKAFLKAPLKYSRISSGFSYSRKHPVTRKVQPHTGVDYAAPAGTPVMSIGDGVVTSRKNEGAGGNTVRIKHNSVYSTAYLHLSKYASGLKVGQRVRQGEVIGYVGSTGRSTGPHLDFRVWKNGTPINPLKMESPPAEPVRKENKAAFLQRKTAIEASVDTLRAVSIADRLFEIL
ncbi:MAG: peptidoglycan DD-metalloendopeptidase family protein [Candidatus Cryptobacteroides sp.]